MKSIFTSMCKEIIIHYDSDVLIMKNDLSFEFIRFCDIRDYQFRKENIEKQGGIIFDADKQSSPSKIIDKAPYLEIKLVLGKAA